MEKEPVVRLTCSHHVAHHTSSPPEDTPISMRAKAYFGPSAWWRFVLHSQPENEETKDVIHKVERRWNT
jgi:hypothetical protein